MNRFNKHLAEALEECNDKVHECEKNGTEEQKLDAYIMRGTILSMMESYISAYTDFDEAIELIASMESEGKKTDPGIFVKAYVSRGKLQYAISPEKMAKDYDVAAERLNDLNENSRFFDRKKIIGMCIDCIEDLLDEGYPENILPFYEKAERILFDKLDAWSQNRYVEILNLMGNAKQEKDEYAESIEYLNRSVALCQELMKKEALEDETVFVFALILRGDAELFAENMEAALRDYEASVSILEIVMAYHRPETRELLIQTHRDISNILIKMGEDEEAEKHMVRALRLNIEDGLDELDSL